MVCISIPKWVTANSVLGFFISLVRPVFLWHNLAQSNANGKDGNE
jgi:hypothetical protein